MKSANVAAALAGLALAGCCAAAGVAQADPNPTPPPSPTPAVTPAPASVPAPPPAPRTVIDADGNYAVGTDIVPGIYRSAGPAGETACYWKRVRGDQIVDNAMTKKPQVVQIEPTDTMFRTHRCAPWQKTECPPDCPPPQQHPPGIPGDLKDFLSHPPSGPALGGGR